MSKDKKQEFHQIEIKFNVVKSTEVNGIEMGVLDDGTPFLTGRALAKICGVDHKALSSGGELKDKKINQLIDGQGFEGGELYLKVQYKSQEVHAYPDAVCTAFLEYYAFEAGRYCTEIAKTNFRLLARKSLRDFIYLKTGYDPKATLLSSWRHYHDRLMLNSLPNGYFSVFRETADIVLTWIQEGLVLDSHTIPDISVGKIWSKYWQSNDYDVKYGQRIKYPHDYPDYFPQAKANGDISAFIFPLAALGDFRLWIQNEYLPCKFPGYLSTKVKQGAFPASKKEAMLKALSPSLPKQLP